MAAKKLLDFIDIVNAVIEELKVQSSDTVSINTIKRDINMVYIDEVVPFARFKWLEGYVEKEHKEYYNVGTCAVTPTSTTVTLSIAPAAIVGSKTNYWFSVEGYGEIYKISSHTALSTTVTLTSPYTGILNATASYKIWTDKVNLPTDCRETLEVWHDFDRKPMEGRGLKDLRRIMSMGGMKSEARPVYYNTADFYDPVAPTAETETNRYRLMQVYPSLSNLPTTLHISYIKELTALDSDGDEPAMPIEDRIVLVYGALHRAWSRERNPEEAARNYQLFNAKLARMAGKVEDSIDKPALQPDAIYINAKRGSRIAGLRARLFPAGNIGGTSYAAPTYASGITLNGGTITANFTVSPAITIDGRDLSVDGANADAHIAASANVHGIGASSSVVGTQTTQTLTNKILSGNTAVTLISGSGTAALNTTGTITLPNATDTLVGKATTDTLTNKTMVASSNAITATVGRLAQFNVSTGNLEASAIVAAALASFELAGPLTLTDNTAVAASTAYTFVHATYKTAFLFVKLVRGANYESRWVQIVTNGATAQVSESAATIGAMGVTFTADISGANCRLLYTTTSTGTNATLNLAAYKL